MRRTGNLSVSPATAMQACGDGGMTKEALMDTLKVDGDVVELLSRSADRRQRRRAGLALLQTEERGVATAAPQQVVVASALDDLAALDHQNGVGMHDGVQAVRDHDGGAVLAEVFDGFLNLLFGFRIQRGGRLIEQDD